MKSEEYTKKAKELTEGIALNFERIAADQREIDEIALRQRQTRSIMAKQQEQLQELNQSLLDATR